MFLAFRKVVNVRQNLDPETIVKGNVVHVGTAKEQLDDLCIDGQSTLYPLAFVSSNTNGSVHTFTLSFLIES